MPLKLSSPTCSVPPLASSPPTHTHHWHLQQKTQHTNLSRRQGMNFNMNLKRIFKKMKNCPKFKCYQSLATETLSSLLIHVKLFTRFHQGRWTWYTVCFFFSKWYTASDIFLLFLKGVISSFSFYNLFRLSSEWFFLNVVI